MANTVRFIHAADVHLGTAFKQANLSDPQLGEALSRATYEAFDRVMDHAIKEGVDFVILAGDTLNSAGMNLRAQSYLAAKLSDLTERGIRVFLVHGNHDPSSGSIGATPLPEGVHVFSPDGVEAVDVVATGGSTCTLYGRSYLRSEERNNLATDFHRGEGIVNAVGILHANVGGSAALDPYSPCSVADLSAARMDYWALGHIHQERVVSDASPLAIYPGSTQALTINEIGRHGCYLVELTDGNPHARWLPTGTIGVAHVEVDLSECSSVAELPQRARTAIVDAHQNMEIPHLVRLVLTGRRSFTTPLTDDVLGQLTQAVQQLVSNLAPRIWIDGTVTDRSRLGRMDEVESSSNPFIRAAMTLADNIDVSTLIDTAPRLGRTDGRSTAVAQADRALLEALGADSAELLVAAKEYAVSVLLGEDE